MLKRLLLVFLLLFSVNSLCAAESATTYHNDKYGFTLNLPAGFKDTPFEAPFALHAYTNEKIFVQLRYIDPQDNYSGPNFGKVPKKEIEDFIKRQRLVAALNTSKFSFLKYDTHVTPTGLPYVWAMFMSDMAVGEDHFHTYMLKNYFLNKNIIIQIDFIVPEEYLRDSTKTIDSIVNSLQFTHFTQ